MLSESIFIKDLKQQADGRFQITYDNGIIRKNIAFCCNSKHFTIDGDDYFEIYFEGVNKLDGTPY